MKKFAYFLPQFHEIQENNEWWGKGFTEWINVKSAKSLYEGHKQPVHPLNNNYYNLLDKETVLWQTKLMHDYSVDGLIYYHYYFCGKKLLEKPAENLLKWKDINQPFFFCWANHSWKKSWDGTSKMLLEQTFGDQTDWEEHFQYLLPFFKDSRYEKKDNKPLFMVFNPNFEKEENIMEYFNKRCIDNGFNGIYVIDAVYSEKQFKTVERKYSQQYHFRQPAASMTIYSKTTKGMFDKIIDKFYKILKIEPIFRIYDGNKFLELSKENYNHNNIIPGLFFSWDNTPRHEKRGYIINSITKEIFMDYMDSIKDSEYVFINAWNEWCEGMMLEPTEENGFKYLEWIKEWSQNNDK